MSDTVWAEFFYAEGLWAEDFWAGEGGGVTPDPETPREIGGDRIVGGTFSRKKWRELKAEIEQERLATERKAVKKAAVKAQDAVEAAEQSGIDVSAQLARMQEHLEAAVRVRKLSVALAEARKTAELADQIMAAIDEEDEAVALLLLY